MKQFQAIQWTDVNGKQLYYIRLTNGDKTHLINVGEKTYKAVTELDKETAQREKTTKTK